MAVSEMAQIERDAVILAIETRLELADGQFTKLVTTPTVSSERIAEALRVLHILRAELEFRKALRG